MTDQMKYEAFMEAMRKKLENPPYMGGNKREAYREGIRAAMSKMKDLYGRKS